MGRRSKKGATPKRTRVYVIQDKSGSMQVLQDATISGFNEYIGTLRDESEGEVSLTLTQFDTRVDEVYKERKLADVPDLDYESYRPGGMTALLDAVGRTVRHAEQAGSPKDRVIVTIMTDGHENSSVEWTKEAVADLIDKKRDNDDWQFVFLGAGPNAWGGASMLGIADSHTINYSGDAHDHGVALRSMATTHAHYSSGAVMTAAFDPQVKSMLEADAKAKVSKPKQRVRTPA